MLCQSESGRHENPLTIRLPQPNPTNTSVGQSRSVWQRWQLLHNDILRHVRACDRLGIELTVEQLADELDEALGLVERRVQELHCLRMLTRHEDGRIELDSEEPGLCA